MGGFAQERMTIRWLVPTSTYVPSQGPRLLGIVGVDTGWPRAKPPFRCLVVDELRLVPYCQTLLATCRLASHVSLDTCRPTQAPGG